MWEAYLLFSILLLIISFLPIFKSQHWLFRIWDFGKIQLTVAIAITFAAGFFLNNVPTIFYYIQALLLLTFVYHCIVLLKYTSIYPRKKHTKTEAASKILKVISANIYLFNTDYKRFISLINKYEPDVFLTMESDDKWGNALEVLKNKYPHQIEVPLKNTYGMHFYSKLKIEKSKVHFFVADDIPSIEVHLKDEDGHEFVFFGIHPPPPSPTEEKNSKERDGDLLSVAKTAKKLTKPVLVIGDFNNVAWSNSSILFKKASELIDPRIGRGFISTYHAKYKLLRFPIDLMFHSEEIFIEKLDTLEQFGSDHLPVLCEFYIDKKNTKQVEEIETTTIEEEQKVEEMIEEGKEETSETR